MTADTAGVSTDTAVADPRVTAAGEEALAQAQALARRAAAPATLRAYKADWAHYASWCAQAGFVPVPAAPAIVGAYLASLAESHAPTTIRRRLSAIGKMHRFNDLPWNSAHRDIQEPLRGLLRQHGRPPHKAAPLTLPMLRRLLATCDPSARGRRDRALLLFGFAGALRRSELVALRVEDVGVTRAGRRFAFRAARPIRRGRGRRSVCRAASTPRPALRGLSRRGRRWHAERPARCSAASAAPAASVRPHCIRTRCAGSWHSAPAWRGSNSTASSG